MRIALIPWYVVSLENLKPSLGLRYVSQVQALVKMPCWVPRDDSSSSVLLLVVDVDNQRWQISGFLETFINAWHGALITSQMFQEDFLSFTGLQWFPWTWHCFLSLSWHHHWSTDALHFHFIKKLSYLSLGILQHCMQLWFLPSLSPGPSLKLSLTKKLVKGTPYSKVWVWLLIKARTGLIIPLKVGLRSKEVKGIYQCCLSWCCFCCTL